MIFLLRCDTCAKHASLPPCLITTFIQVADLDALKAEEASQKSKLEQKLIARRQKKTQELRQRKEKELKNKQTRDAKALQVI